MPDPSLPAAKQLEMLEGGPGADQNMAMGDFQMENVVKSWPEGMQRDYSSNSIVSKTTAATKFGANIESTGSLVMGPSFQFGIQKID